MRDFAILMLHFCLLIMGASSSLWAIQTENYQNKIFSYSPIFHEKGHIKRMSLYKGFIDEGIKLKNNCDYFQEPQYSSEREENRVINTIMANLQYLGLKESMNYLVKHFKQVHMSEDEWSEYSGVLVDQYCSENLSLISLKNLKKEMTQLFKEEQNNKDYGKTNGLLAIELFQSFCSWGGQVDKPGLLKPFLNSEAIMAWVFRFMTEKELYFNPEDQRVYLAENSQEKLVLCENMICRKIPKNEFLRTFPLALGESERIKNLENLYCHHFRDLSYSQKEYSKKMNDWIKSRDIISDKMLVSTFISFLNHTHDYFLEIEEFNKIPFLVENDIDEYWNTWSRRNLETLSQELYFEESLSLEVYTREKNKFPPQIHIDINFGELDKEGQKMGKLSFGLKLKLNPRFLSWLRQKVLSKDYYKTDLKKKMQSVLTHHIEDQIHEAFQKFLLNYIHQKGKEALINRISFTLLDSLNLDKDFINSANTQEISIPIQFHLSPYALRHLYLKKK